MLNYQKNNTMYIYMGIFNMEDYDQEIIEKTNSYSISYFESVLMRIKLTMEIASQFIYKKKIIKLNDLNQFNTIHQTLIPYKSQVGILIYLPYFSGSSNNSFISVKINNLKINTNYQLITVLNVQISIDKEKGIIIEVGGISNNECILKNGIVKFKLNFTTNDDITNTHVIIQLHVDNTTNLKSSDKICILFIGIREI